MRFLHTADWHLGRLFYNSHLTSDQAHVLDQLVDLAKEASVEAVLVSGDIFDRPLPPSEAVELLDETLARLVLDVGVTVVVIAGNHDSPERLAFGSRLLAKNALHVFGHPTPSEPVVLEGDSLRVLIHAVPYAEPALVRVGLADDTIHDHHAALAALLTQIPTAGRATAHGRSSAAGGSGRARQRTRAVLLAHAFVVGGMESESERPLSVGGSSAVNADLFAGFDYVALGHLHRPQSVTPAGGLPGVVADGAARYAGSLLKYSFSEVGHQKTVSVVDLAARGPAQIEEVALSPRRDLRRIEGSFADILSGRPQGLPPEGCEDYMLVALQDRGPVFDAMARLRERYPNVMTIERPDLSPAPDATGARRDHRRLDERDLFAAFYEGVTGASLSAQQQQVVAEVLEAALAAWRSGAAEADAAVERGGAETPDAKTAGTEAAT